VVRKLREVVSEPHVESYNYFVEHGLAAGIRDLEPIELDLVDPKLRMPVHLQPESHKSKVIDWDDSTVVKFWVQDAALSSPMKRRSAGGGGGGGDSSALSIPLLPRECRERGLLYGGQLSAIFCFQVIRRRNGACLNSPVVKLDRKTFGELPIMVLSERCHLRTMSPAQLVQHKEEVRLCLCSFDRLPVCCGAHQSDLPF
jgi:DNA-directed RNA polymerase beta subunit